MSHGAELLTLHTLGPEGTNCAEAARFWLSQPAGNGTPQPGKIVLHPTLEEAAAAMTDPANEQLISCAAYPELHTFIFSRLERLVMTHSFVMPTHPMVLARRPADSPTSHGIDSIATHPAPRHLANPLQGNRVHDHRTETSDTPSIVLANSNADAAVLCAAGEADACITTEAAAEIHGLTTVRNYGPVPMAFLIHAMRS